MTAKLLQLMRHQSELVGRRMELRVRFAELRIDAALANQIGMWVNELAEISERIGELSAAVTHERDAMEADRINARLQDAAAADSAAATAAQDGDAVALIEHKGCAEA